MYNKTSDNIKHIFLSSKTFLNFVSLLINYILKMYIKRKYRQGGSELLRITSYRHCILTQILDEIIHKDISVYKNCKFWTFGVLIKFVNQMFLFDWVVADIFNMTVAKLKKLILYQKEDYVLHVVTCYWVTTCFVNHGLFVQCDLYFLSWDWL